MKGANRYMKILLVFFLFEKKIHVGQFDLFSLLVLFLLFSVIVDGFKWFWMASFHKNIQLCWSSSRFHSWSYTFPTVHKWPSDDVICDVAIYADHTTLYCNCDQASDLWKRLELASKLESDLWNTVDWGKKWLVDFNAGKTQLVSFDQSNNSGSIDVKMHGSVLEEKSSFKMLGLTCSFKLDWGS